MKKLIGIALLSCLAGGSQAAGLSNLFGALAGRSGAMGHGGGLEAALADISAHLNSRTPLLAGDGTVLQRVSAEPGLRLTYYYTLRRPRRELATGDFDRIAEPALRTRVCGNQDMQSLLRSGITLAFHYRDADGSEVGQASIEPGACSARS